jgi:hypothetical protein
MNDDNIPGILEVIDREIASQRASRADAVGQFVSRVLQAADPDTEFEYLARAYIENQGQDTRRKCVTLLAKAFGAGRPQLKKILRAKGIVLEND